MLQELRLRDNIRRATSAVQGITALKQPIKYIEQDTNLAMNKDTFISSGVDAVVNKIKSQGVPTTHNQLRFVWEYLVLFDYCWFVCWDTRYLLFSSFNTQSNIKCVFFPFSGSSQVPCVSVSKSKCTRFLSFVPFPVSRLY